MSSDRRPIYAGRIVDLGLERARLPDGREVELEIIRHPGAAAVVPLHDDGTVTLVHQHRHAAGGMIYEIPAGVLEPGEPPAACAARAAALSRREAPSRPRRAVTPSTAPATAACAAAWIAGSKPVYLRRQHRPPDHLGQLVDAHPVAALDVEAVHPPAGGVEDLDAAGRAPAP